MDVSHHVLECAAHAVLPSMAEGASEAIAGSAVGALAAPLKRIIERIRAPWSKSPPERRNHELLKELLAETATDRDALRDLIVVAGHQITRDRFEICGDAQLNTGDGVQNVHTGGGTQQNIDSIRADGGHIEIGTNRG